MESCPYGRMASSDSLEAEMRHQRQCNIAAVVGHRGMVQHLGTWWNISLGLEVREGSSATV